MYQDLDPLIHSQLRLAIMSILISVEEAEFNYIKQQTNASSGNISVQLNKLKHAGYIEINKSFKGNYPQTICKITPFGIERFEAYVETLKKYLPGNQ